MPKQGSAFLARLRKQIEQSGKSKKGFWFVKEGQKRRIRFAPGSDLEQGIVIPWHAKWVGNRSEVDSPCLSLYGKDCPFCDQEGVSTRERYAWTIYDYESGERQVFMFGANRSTPVPHLAANYEEWTTLLTRDVVVKRTGKGTDTVYSVIGNSESKFRVAGVKAFSEAQILKMVWEAFGQGSLDNYPDEGADDEEYEDSDEELDDETEDDDEDTDDDDYEDDDEEEELPAKKSKSKATLPKFKKAAGRR